MQLKNIYYRIIDTNINGSTAVFRMSILPGCDIYRGHFPGNPVCPGVCNIGVIKECAMLLTNKKLFISTIKQCRLTAVASPSICPEVDITISVLPDNNVFTVTAKITVADKVYMEFKGEMTV